MPGHGPVLHDKTYLYPVGDLLRSTVDQLDARLATVGPAMFHTVDDVRPGIDLTLFRIRFAGGDEEPGARFDQMAAELVDLASREASLR